jgi:hypothetical protein
MNRIVGIHQPNFFPWLGYFDKIINSDVFVLLDDVQFPKKGGTWSNRVKLINGKKDIWLTAPVDRSYHGTRLISEIEFKTSCFKEKAFSIVSDCYNKHYYYEELEELIKTMFLNPAMVVSDYNLEVLKSFCDLLGIDKNKILKMSCLNYTGRSNELLISLTQSVGGNTYMYGGGASGYHDEKCYFEAGVNLVSQSFCHPSYPQKGNPNNTQIGLSIIDVLMNIGIDETKKLLFNRNV